jgi:hypothetical protein
VGFLALAGCAPSVPPVTGTAAGQSADRAVHWALYDANCANEITAVMVLER